MSCWFDPRPSTIKSWLAALNLSVYEDAFTRGDFTVEANPTAGRRPGKPEGCRPLLEKLARLTDEQLRDMGIRHPGHRKRLLIAVSKLDLSADDLSDTDTSYPQSTYSKRTGSSWTEQHDLGAEHGDHSSRWLAMVQAHARPVAFVLFMLLPMFGADSRILFWPFTPVVGLLISQCTGAARLALFSIRCGGITVGLGAMLRGWRLLMRLLAHGGADDLVRLLTAVSNSLLVLLISFRAALRSDVDARMLWSSMRRNIIAVGASTCAANAILHVMFLAAPDVCVVQGAYAPGGQVAARCPRLLLGVHCHGRMRDGGRQAASGAHAAEQAP